MIGKKKYFHLLAETFKEKNNTEMNRNWGEKFKNIRNSMERLIIEIKGIAAKFHKSIVIFWAKANL